MTEFPELPAADKLLVDDPFWRYRSSTAAGGGIAHLRMWAAKGDHCRVAVVTDTGLGSSITNSVEHIWEQLRLEYAGLEIVLLEHWPAGTGACVVEHLDQVVVAGGRPQWRRVWPTDPSNLNHVQFRDWMTTHGHQMLGTSA